MKTKIDFGLPKATWPAPKLYGVGNFTEFGLYQVALTTAKINGFINQEVLMSEIPQRIKGLVVVDKRRCCGSVGLRLLLPLARVLLLGLVQRLVVDGRLLVGAISAFCSRHLRGFVCFCHVASFPVPCGTPELPCGCSTVISWAVRPVRDSFL